MIMMTVALQTAWAGKTSGKFDILTDDSWQYILDKYGYDSASARDLTDSSKIKLTEPRCAYVNITGISAMPTKKTQNQQAWLEFYDGGGNFFKKRVILNAQGNTSMGFPKRSMSVDFYEDEWGGEKETDIKIGGWVKQSSFHLKANYTGYFRGESQIGYMIYDDIISDREQPMPWQRAGIPNAAKDASCHPHGFPCYVYLNGKFYGLFAWQLKKHRKNMGLTKDLAEHVHLDGALKNPSLWDGTVKWTWFDIRNPKTLYCVNTIEKQGRTTYAEYDGDSPCELIDDTMPYFDPGNEGHVLSDRVKKIILRLSHYTSEIGALVKAKADTATIRAKYEECFDVQGMIDYIVMSYVTSNGDGFEKNWQWFTYDGVKWFVQPYDMDCIFGNMWQGKFLFPAETFWYYHNYDKMIRTGPINYFLEYFGEDIASRYRELRRSGQISCSSIMNHFHSWYERITPEGYDLEYNKWPDSPCNGESVINPEWTTSDSYWLEYTWDGYYRLEAYDNTRTYQAGDRCTSNDRIWTATTTTIGIPPYTKLAHTDNLERVESYVSRKIELLDGFFDYNPIDDGIKEPPSDNQPATRKVIRDKHLYIIKDGETYSIDGKKIHY